MAKEITSSNYDELIATGLPVVIDFSAEWCGPCKMIAPIIDELATEYDGKIVIGKCDVDEDDDMATKFAVRNIPTIVFIKGGELVDKHVGAATKSALKEKLNALL